MQIEYIQMTNIQEQNVHLNIARTEKIQQPKSRGF